MTTTMMNDIATIMHYNAMQIHASMIMLTIIMGVLLAVIELGIAGLLMEKHIVSDNTALVIAGVIIILTLCIIRGWLLVGYLMFIAYISYYILKTK